MRNRVAAPQRKETRACNSILGDSGCSACFLAGCGGSDGKSTESGDETEAACTKPALSEAPDLPKGWPQIENVTYTQAVATGADDRRRGLLRRRRQGRARRLQTRARRCGLHDPVRRARGGRLGSVLERSGPLRPSGTAERMRQWREGIRPRHEPAGLIQVSAALRRVLIWTRCAELCSSRQVLARSHSSSASRPSAQSTHSKPWLRVSRATPLTVQGRHFRFPSWSA